LGCHRKAARVKELAAAIGRMRAHPGDDEARETLAVMSNEELANILLGSGAHQLQAWKNLGELLNIGVGTPAVDDLDDCPVGKGEIDCPILWAI